MVICVTDSRQSFVNSVKPEVARKASSRRFVPVRSCDQPLGCDVSHRCSRKQWHRQEGVRQGYDVRDYTPDMTPASVAGTPTTGGLPRVGQGMSRRRRPMGDGVETRYLDRLIN